MGEVNIEREETKTIKLAMQYILLEKMVIVKE
jgi:hypothetical protein